MLPTFLVLPKAFDEHCIAAVPQDLALLYGLEELLVAPHPPYLYSVDPPLHGVAHAVDHLTLEFLKVARVQGGKV